MYILVVITDLHRFVHQLGEAHSSQQACSSQVSSALECVSVAEGQYNNLVERVGREETLLGEKTEACLKLLVQIGQDTAILKQHSRLLTKQKERITHLRKVYQPLSFRFTHCKVHECMIHIHLILCKNS